MKTAEQILEKFWPNQIGEGIDYESTIKAMKLYASQKIDEAAEKANIVNTFTFHDGTTEEKFTDGVKYGDYTHTVNKQSILSLKDKV